MSWFCLAVVGDILRDFHGLTVQLEGKHVPLAPVVLVVALVLLVIGSFSLLFGYHARHGAVLLFGLAVVSTVTLHDFWHVAAGPARDGEFQIFARDMAIAGGLLLVVGLGAGPFALDNKSGGGNRRR